MAIPLFDIANVKPLNVGNAYTYTIAQADRDAYSAFMVTANAPITVSDGTNSVTLTLVANTPIALNDTFQTIVGAIDNNVVFVY